MKITCIQMDMAFSQPEENFRRAERLIEQAMQAQPDVLVLPETWNTGYFPRQELHALCDRDGQEVIARIGALAEKHHVNIVAGSVANLRGGKCYNTALVFDRSGKCIASYDKTHLFSPMGEDDYFTPGDHLCRFSLDGTDCALIICYDLRFPELSRSLAVAGMDVLFVVSQWPASRIAHMHALTAARAIENQAFAVCCNSCGAAGELVHGGRSVIFDPMGTALATAGAEETLLTTRCDLSTLRSLRTAINVFSDRRPELYRL